MVPLQQNKDSWKPVAYASQPMSENRKTTHQIEKEALAVTWPSEISLIILQIEDDHKPLILTFSMKHAADAIWRY